MKAFALALALPALALSAPSSTLPHVIENARLLSVSSAGQQAYLQSCKPADALCAEWSAADALFHSSQTEREVPAGHWAAALADRQKFCDVPVFYPFGGPDVIFPRRLFPSCQVFVLAGLEPVGGAELFGDLHQYANAAFVRAARRSLASLLARGYFVTRYLERDLRADRAGGVLPLMLMQLVRGGAVVRDILIPELGINGQFRMLAFSKESTNISAICILFNEAGQPKVVKKICYFRQDLSDGHFAGSDIERLFRGGRKIRVFLKSASYLLHGSGFSELAKLLLGKSEEIIQDDSGLPVSALAAEKWSLHAYGRYGPLLAEFREFYQPALATLAQQSLPLPFHIGYQGSMFLHLVRKTAVKQKHLQ